MNNHESLTDLSHAIVEQLTREGHTIATAESLTGGLVCATLIDTPGASECVRGGACTYATDTKASILGVDAQHLKQAGPVDPDTATMMARGAARIYDADYGVATTGVAGPGPSEGHDAGTVFLALYRRTDDTAVAYRYSFSGNRPQVRMQAVRQILAIVLSVLRGHLGDHESHRVR